MLHWWQELIQNIIRKKNQIYINYKDLEIITTIHNMKPSPLKAILRELKKQGVFVREEDLFEQKRKEIKPKKWH